MMKKSRVIYEIFFGFLAVVSVILAIIDMNDRLTLFLSFIDHGIWLLFVADYVIRFIISKNKLNFIKSNIFDLIAILPFNSVLRIFRTLKFLKLLKLVKMSKTFRMFAVLGRFVHKLERFLNTNGFKYMLLIVVLFTLIGGALISTFENISFFDGIWWAFVTTTTVGYGDISPNSVGGRIVACVLMLAGIGLVGSLTSTITSYFMHTSQHDISHDKIQMTLALYEQLSDEEKIEFTNIITKQSFYR